MAAKYIKRESLDFAKSANAKCLTSLGDPKLSIDGGTYTRILAALDSDERIPYVSALGYDDTTTTANDENGEMLLYNFWKDSKVSYILKCVCDDVIMHGGCNIMTPLNFSFLTHLSSFFTQIESKGYMA